MRNAKIRSDKMVKAKFLLYKIKNLIRDGRGKLVYADAFDMVINDIYGVKHLVRNINDLYDNRDVIATLDECGIDTMVKMFSNPRLSNILVELVEAKYMMEDLRKDIRKQANKRGRRSKNDIKKYKFLSDRYKRGSKFLRKRLGIKSVKTAYKSHFKALNELDDNYNNRGFFNQDDDDFFSDDWGDFSYDYDDYDDEDEDDYYSTSELDDFCKMMTGKNPRDDLRRRKEAIRQSARRKSRYDDFDFDYDDDEDEDAQYSRISKEITEDVDDRIDKVADTVAELSEAVNAMLNKNEYERNCSRRQRAVNVDDLPDDYLINLKHGNPPDQPSDQEIYNDFVKKLSDDVVDIRKLSYAMASRIDELTETQNDIIDAYNDLIDDDSDETEVVVDQNQSSSRPNVYANNRGNSSTMTREELIDQINQAQGSSSAGNSQAGEKAETANPAN